jgi:hypothetical protein
MTPKNRNDLLTLWRFSKLDSVQQVAQNTDIMRLIFAELEPMFQYNRVVKEYNDPRFKSHSRRVFKESRANDVHPGRWLVHIIYPQLQHWPYHIVRKFECEDINLHGCMIQTQDRHWKNNFDLEPSYNSMRSFTHDDLNTILASYGYTDFTSKKKHEKIHPGPGHKPRSLLEAELRAAGQLHWLVAPLGGLRRRDRRVTGRGVRTQRDPAHTQSLFIYRIELEVHRGETYRERGAK